jgi:hypothetical protein
MEYRKGIDKKRNKNMRNFLSQYETTKAILSKYADKVKVSDISVTSSDMKAS